MKTRGTGPAAAELGRRLRAVESRNVTWLGESFPTFWEEARGANVRDADGNVYVDLTGAFGVALTGHRDPAIVEAVRDQAGRLLHGMGDVHPPALKVEYLERLCRALPWDDPRVVLSSTGSEAVEAALKTAVLATGRSGVVSFEGGYHGLTLGALASTARAYFREPFRERLYRGTAVVPFPDRLRDGRGAADRSLEEVRRVLDGGAPNGDPVGAVLVEPIQGRAGVRVPPPGFLEELGALAREHGALLVVDEVFTGAGRTGDFLASTGEGVEPDLVCLGKALGGGLPLSACAGPASLMEAWPASPGEALHTSTFLGHPLACAAGSAVLDRLADAPVRARIPELGGALLDALERVLEGAPGVSGVRGRGLMVGIELREGGPEGAPAGGAGVRVAHRALAEGVLVLPAGDHGHVVQLTPPVTLTGEQLGVGVEVLAGAIRREALGP